MIFDQCAANIEAQAKPRAGTVTHTNPRHFVEALPDILLLLYWNARPSVLYCHPHALIFDFYVYHDWLAGIRIFERIGQIIHQYLPDAITINLHGNVANVWCFQRNDALWHTGTYIFNNSLYQRQQIM